MTPHVSHVLESAMALSPDERIDLAAELLRSVGIEETERFEALRRDVAAGLEQIDRGEGVVLEADQIGDYLRERGRLAVARASATTA